MYVKFKSDDQLVYSELSYWDVYLLCFRNELSPHDILHHVHISLEIQVVSIESVKYEVLKFERFKITKNYFENSLTDNDIVKKFDDKYLDCFGLHSIKNNLFEEKV